VAEFDSTILRENACVKTTFVIEAINNLYPVTLLTEKICNPNASTDDYIPYCCTPPHNLKNHPFSDEIMLWELKSILNWKLLCQYCAFSRKKVDGELFASHSEDLHNSISKAVEYCLSLHSFAENWMKDPEMYSYWRIFQWRPIIVLKDNLYNQVKNDLIKVDSCKLVYNFHFKSQPKAVAVDFVTEAGLPKLISYIVSEDDVIEEKLFKLRLQKKVN
jgi:hypothetical protein